MKQKSLGLSWRNIVLLPPYIGLIKLFLAPVGYFQPECVVHFWQNFIISHDILLK